MTINTPLLLGIDGGGTSCRARLCAHDGAVLGEGHAGPANVRLGSDKAFAAVLAATMGALNAAGMDGAALDRLYAGLGLAGVNLSASFREALAFPLPFARTMLATDTEIARLGAHGGGDGGVVIIGTGSCAEGRIKDQMLRLGGWGFALGDQGSGAAIGRAALCHSLLVHDCLAPPSMLGRAVLAEFDDDPEAMVFWSEGAGPGDYARFAPLVPTHAQSGDAAATKIIRVAAAAIDGLIFGLAAAHINPVALLGGMAGALRPWLSAEALASLVEPQGTALDGAVLLARSGTTSEMSP
ncbi:MAG: BadF/BadG/BcrA/BcrD ATPase family protein [Geminicoccaceae bacterium]